MSLLLLPFLLAGSGTAFLEFNQEKSELVCRQNASSQPDFKLIFEGSNKAVKMEIIPIEGGTWPKEAFATEHPMYALQLIDSFPIKPEDRLRFTITTGPLGHIEHTANHAKFDVDFRLDTSQNQVDNKTRFDSARIAFFTGFDGYVTRQPALYQGECIEPEALSNDKEAAQ